MLDDDDEWPIRCPSCGHRILKKIGWLKDNAQLRCTAEGCSANLWYLNDTFRRELDQARRAIRDFSRTVRLTKAELSSELEL
jgi:hypothetical protein